MCTSVTREDGRGGEYSPPLILYIEKGEGKEGEWKDFLFMIVSILPVSLIRSNNIMHHKVAQIFLFQNGNLIPV